MLHRIALALGLVRPPPQRQAPTVAAPPPEPVRPLYQPHAALLEDARKGIEALKRRNGRDTGETHASPTNDP